MNKKKMTVFLTIAVFLAFFANALYAQESSELTINDLMQMDEPKQEQIQEKEVEKVPEDKTIQEPKLEQEDKTTEGEKTEDKDKNEEMFVFPVFSISWGTPENWSMDLGGDFLWYKTADISTGFYGMFEYSDSDSQDNMFFRLSAGSSTYCTKFWMLTLRVGGGLGIMPENNQLLLTAFAEASLSGMIVEVKVIYEFPLGPEELKNYYNDNYSPFKVKVGLANLFHLLFMV
ncbi:MAG: hypothetical protein IKQ43_06280 [Treponema sp.]|nr:hypothetical protein [Treponema sp.]